MQVDELNNESSDPKSDSRKVKVNVDDLIMIDHFQNKETLNRSSVSEDIVTS